jgi:hypothetical protein
VEVLESGCTANEITSVRIAEAAFLYVGEEEVSKYRPYEAMLKDVWTVFRTAKPSARRHTCDDDPKRATGRPMLLNFSAREFLIFVLEPSHGIDPCNGRVGYPRFSEVANGMPRVTGDHLVRRQATKSYTEATSEPGEIGPSFVDAQDRN